MEGYQPYSVFEEAWFQPQQFSVLAHKEIIVSFMFYNVSSVTLWHSSKAADSVRHDKVFNIVVIT